MEEKIGGRLKMEKDKDLSEVILAFVVGAVMMTVIFFVFVVVPINVRVGECREENEGLHSFFDNVRDDLICDGSITHTNIKGADLCSTGWKYPWYPVESSPVRKEIIFDCWQCVESCEQIGLKVSDNCFGVCQPREWSETN